MRVCDIEHQSVNVLRSRPNDRYFEEDISNSFPSTIVLELSFTFYWKFSRVMSTICNNLALVLMVNGLASNRQQVIIWSNAAHVYRGIHASSTRPRRLLIKHKGDSSPYILIIVPKYVDCVYWGGGFRFFFVFFLGGGGGGVSELIFALIIPLY